LKNSLKGSFQGIPKSNEASQTKVKVEPNIALFNTGLKEGSIHGFAESSTEDNQLL